MQVSIVGKCDIDNGIAERQKVKADLFEAILGGSAVESKWNAEVLQNAISKMLQINNYLDALDGDTYRPEKYSLENAINTLKEIAEHEECSIPIYEFSGPNELGYDEDDNPKWSCICSVSSWALCKVVFATSKKLAKKYAAYLVLCDHYELLNEYEAGK